MACCKIFSRFSHNSRLSAWFDTFQRNCKMTNYICVQVQSRTMCHQGVNLGLAGRCRLLQRTSSCLTCSQVYAPCKCHLAAGHENTRCSSIFSPFKHMIKSSPCYNYSSKRWKKRGKGSSTSNSGEDPSDESDEDEDDSEEDADADTEYVFYEEDKYLPNNYKHVKKYLKSPRMDAVIGAAFNIARNKVGDYFLESKLRHNGVKALQKSKQLSVGDYVDLVSEAIDNGTKLKVKRVRVLAISKEKSRKDRLAIEMRAWKGNVVIDNYDSGKYGRDR